MIYNFSKKLLYLLICCLAGLCGLTGCSTPADYKDEADKQVYNIIDRKWDKKYGTKVNYRIGDVTPSPNDIQIQKAVPESGILTLTQALELATAHNRQYQLEKELLYLKALDLTSVIHDISPQFFGGTAGRYAKEDNNKDNDEGIGAEADFGFNQLLTNGTIISTRVAAAWVDILTGNLRSGLVGIFDATIVQPLLRGRLVVQENLTQAERDTLYQVRSFNRFRRTFVVSIITQYYQVLQQFDIAKNAENNYNTLLDVYQRAEKLANAGRLPLFELDQAHQDKLQARDTFLQEQKLYKQMLDEFKIALSLATNAEFQLDENELDALRKAEMTEPDFSEAEAIETALIQRLDLANSADAVADAERKVTVAIDNLRAGLNLVARTRTTSSDTADLGNMRFFRDAYDLNLELQLPLDRIAERNVLRFTQIILAQRQREYEQAADTVVLEVRQAYRDLIEAAQRYQVQLENRTLAQKRFENTLLLLQYGRANTRDVLDAQEDLFQAQNDATTTLVDYTVATLNFYRDVGVLQVRPDGMWQLYTLRRSHLDKGRCADAKYSRNR